MHVVPNPLIPSAHAAFLFRMSFMQRALDFVTLRQVMSFSVFPMHTRSATVTIQAPLVIDNPRTPFSPMEEAQRR
jgi:hypothetical protein